MNLELNPTPQYTVEQAQNFTPNPDEEVSNVNPEPKPDAHLSEDEP